MTDIFKGATSNSVFIELVDSTTGLPKTGIVHTDVTGSYVRTRSARVAITMATLASASAAYSSGGFILIDDTNQPGVYRIDVPDAAFATGAVAVVVTVKATGCRTVSRLFSLVDINNQVACLPNIAAGSVGGLLTAPTTANMGQADVRQLLGTAWLTPGTAGTPDVNTKLISGDSVAADNAESFFDGTGYSGANNVIPRVTLTDTLTTYTNNTPQTGDSFARLGVAGAGLTSIGDTRLANLDVAISVIQSQITAQTNLSAKANWFGYPLLEIPDSGTRAYVFELVIKDDEDKLTNLDANPTIALTNAAGTDRSSLITTVVSNPSAGRYTITITVGTATTNEPLKLTATGTISAETRYAAYGTQVVDYDTATLVNQILTTLGTAGAGLTNIGDTRLTNLNATISSRASQTSVDTIDDYLNTEISALTTAVAAEAVKTTSILSRLGNWTGTGINTILGGMRALAAKATGLTPTDISSGTTYNNVNHSQESISEASGGGGGDATLANQTTMLTILNEIADQTDLIAGPGEDQVTIEILDDLVGVDDVSVWITSDSGGTSVVAGTSVTDGSGQATFLLTAGVSYYLWASKTGKVSIQGRQFTAVADA